MPKYVKVFSLNKDVVLTGDLNCDLLTPRGDASRSFCNSTNATQLIVKPTGVTKSSHL